MILGQAAHPARPARRSTRSLIALSGLRRGEACGLRWLDVDLDAAQFMVVQQLVEIGGAVTVAAPKTAASRLLMPLDAVTAAMLGRLARSPTTAQASGRVFTDHLGRPCGRDT